MEGRGCEVSGVSEESVWKQCKCVRGVGRRGEGAGVGAGSGGGVARSTVAMETTLSSGRVGSSSSHSQVIVGLQAWERTSGLRSATGAREGAGQGEGEE